jgi:hypothetical protein
VTIPEVKAGLERAVEAELDRPDEETAEASDAG